MASDLMRRDTIRYIKDESRGFIKDTTQHVVKHC